MTVSADLTDEDRPIIAGRLFLRSAWIGARLLLVYYLGQQGALFFYQVF